MARKSKESKGQPAERGLWSPYWGEFGKLDHKCWKDLWIIKPI